MFSFFRLKLKTTNTTQPLLLHMCQIKESLSLGCIGQPVMESQSSIPWQKGIHSNIVSTTFHSEIFLDTQVKRKKIILDPIRHEPEFLFPTFSKDSLVNYFPTWVRNTVFHSCSQSQNLAILFFIPIPNPNIWEHCFSFPFPIPNFKKIYWKFYWEIK